MLLWLAHYFGEALSRIGMYPRPLEQVQFRALAATCLSFLIVLWFGKRTIRWLKKMKIGDSGIADVAALAEAANAKKNTPTMGGILIAGAIAGSTILLADLSTTYIHQALIVLGWLATVGAFDDWLKLTAARRGTGRQGLYSWEKFVFQLGIGALVGYFAYSSGIPLKSDAMPVNNGAVVAHVLNLPGQKTYEPVAELSSEAKAKVNPTQVITLADARKVAPAPGLTYLPRWAYMLMAMLMIAGISNALNITDGMDGLAAGVSTAVSIGMVILTLIAGTVGMATYLLVPFVSGSDELAVVAGAMVGACLGFLWWNCSPAQVFMGDTGSLCLGGLVGFMASVIRQEFVILLMCGIFLLELGSVVMQVGFFKLTKGQRIFKCAPIHHHFHMSGWTEQQVVARAWVVSVLLVVLALATIKVR